MIYIICESLRLVTGEVSKLLGLLIVFVDKDGNYYWIRGISLTYPS